MDPKIQRIHKLERLEQELLVAISNRTDDLKTLTVSDLKKMLQVSIKYEKYESAQLIHNEIERKEKTAYH
jgi:hypothetical protein